MPCNLYTRAARNVAGCVDVSNCATPAAAAAAFDFLPNSFKELAPQMPISRWFHFEIRNILPWQTLEQLVFNKDSRFSLADLATTDGIELWTTATKAPQERAGH
jgi:hypothetical protein